MPLESINRFGKSRSLWKNGPCAGKTCSFIHLLEKYAYFMSKKETRAIGCGNCVYHIKENHNMNETNIQNIVFRNKERYHIKA